MKHIRNLIALLLLCFLSITSFADTVNPVIDNTKADKTDSCWVVEVQLQNIFADITTATDDSSSLGNDLTLVANPAAAGGGADVDTRFQGTTSVTYTATDPSGNVTTQCIDYVVKDYIPPMIDLRTLDTVIHCVGSSYIPVAATVSDNLYSESQISLVATSTVDGYLIGTYQDTYTATDAAGNISTKVRIVNVIDCSTAQIEDLYSSTNFILYPNPSSSLLNVKSLDNTPIESIVIINSLGQLAYYQESNSNEMLINISSLSSGFYTLKIVSEGLTSNKQLIIK